MEYLDFELEIGKPVDDRYPIAVRSPAGEARADVRLPVLDGALRRSVVVGRDVAAPGDVASAGATSTSLHAFGRALFDAVFVGEIPARFAVTRERAANANRGIRIRIRCLTPSSAMLPWELLYDGTRRQYLALSAKTVVCRYLELPDPPEPLAVALPLRVLVMISTPSGVEPLDGAGERHRIEAATTELTRSGALTIDWLEGANATYETLRRRMAVPWHVFHFIGHGRFDATTGGGELGFTDEPLTHAAAVPGAPGAVRWVRGDKIGMLSHGAAPLRLAVLNCCRSAESDEASLFASTATQVAASGVPAVLAMQQVVSDASAIAFAGELYDAIARRLPVDTAVAGARKAMMSAADDDFGWALPVLYLRSPDGQLFAHEAPPVPHAPPLVTSYRASIAALVGVSALVIAGLAALAFKYRWFDEPGRSGPNTVVAPISSDAAVCGNGVMEAGEECDVDHVPRVLLRVTPQTYCPATSQIHISWEATAGALLKVTPPDQEPRRVPSSGVRSEQAREMEVTLSTELGGKHVGTTSLVVPITLERPLVGIVSSCDELFVKTFEIKIESGAIDPLAHIQSIINNCHGSDLGDPCPTVTVCHGQDEKNPCTGDDSSHWDVPPGGRVDLSSNNTFDPAGVWMLARRLLPGEHCPGRDGVAIDTGAIGHNMRELKATLKFKCASFEDIPQ